MEPFFKPELSRRNTSEKEPQPDNIVELIDFLDSDELSQEIQKGDITLALIRSNLGTTTNQLASDSEIAEIIEENITDLGMLAKFSIKFDFQAFEDFYDGEPKKVLLGLDPKRHNKFENRWEEFGNTIMADGVTTVLLLHSPDGEAISKWRQQVGHRDIENNRDPSTIRGKFGLDNYSTIVHGSDSPEAVKREIDIIKNCLIRSIDPKNHHIS